jgi:hypothetical protein
MNTAADVDNLYNHFTSGKIGLYHGMMEQIEILTVGYTLVAWYTTYVAVG